MKSAITTKAVVFLLMICVAFWNAHVAAQCESNPCANGGTCTTIAGYGYVCTCTSRQFQGQRCEIVNATGYCGVAWMETIDTSITSTLRFLDSGAGAVASPTSRTMSGWSLVTAAPPDGGINVFRSAVLAETSTGLRLLHRAGSLAIVVSVTASVQTALCEYGSNYQDLFPPKWVFYAVVSNYTAATDRYNISVFRNGQRLNPTSGTCNAVQLTGTTSVPRLVPGNLQGRHADLRLYYYPKTDADIRSAYEYGWPDQPMRWIQFATRLTKGLVPANGIVANDRGTYPAATYRTNTGSGTVVNCSCSSNPCMNGGQCVSIPQIELTDDGEGNFFDVPLSDAWSCNCSFPFIGSRCQTDLRLIDECASNPCQNGATCVDYVNNYNCTCPNGFYGTNCQSCSFTPTTNPAIDADGQSCDCGVVWTRVGTPTASSSPVSLTTTVNLITSAIPMSSVEQAQQLCHSAILSKCKGFLYDTSVADAPMVYFYYNLVGGGNLQTSSGLENVYLDNTIIYALNRFEHNRCNDMSIDPYFLYFESRIGTTTARQYIEYPIETAFCPYSNDCGICCWHPFGPDETVCTNPNPTRDEAYAELTQLWSTAVETWWGAQGHVLRFPPNAGCSLQPSLFTYSSNCANPQTGCFKGDSVLPCGGRGYCDKNDAMVEPYYSSSLYSTPYNCNCFRFSGTNPNGSPVFGNIFQYVGNACQRSSLLSCAAVANPSAVCSGFDTACQPQLLANTAPNNDYEPRCDCNSPTQAPGVGQYCEISRCDPVASCQTLGGSGGACTLTDQGWECVCGRIATGQNCQYSSDPCMANTNDLFVCKARGICNPPYLSSTTYPLITYPNYAYNQSWCACTSGLSYGKTCQNLQCDPAIVTAGRGICALSTGAFDRCLPVYTSSTTPGALKCDVDICATTGGTVTGTGSALTCNCGIFQAGTALTPPLTDLSCYPRCPLSNGTVCGPATGSETNVCTQSVSAGKRVATCTCDFGYIKVRAANSPENQAIQNAWSFPVGTLPEVCEPWCFHGTPPLSWTPSNRLPCSCANTGYNTLDNHPRCDNPVCKNGGTWNAGICTCVGPYTSVSNCAANTCTNPFNTAIVQGVPGINPQNSQVQCICRAPYKHALSAYDCNADRCGPFGVINPAITSSTPVAQMCICSAGVTTFCLDPTGLTCTFCNAGPCTNGGTLITNATSVVGCSCLFPYTGATCSEHLCGTNGQPNGQTCACIHGFTGTTCATSPCLHGGTWNDQTVQCDCAEGWTGSLCASSVCQNGGTYDLGLHTCVCINGYTGSTCTTVPPVVIFSTAAIPQAAESSTGIDDDNTGDDEPDSSAAFQTANVDLPMRIVLFIILLIMGSEVLVRIVTAVLTSPRLDEQ